MVRIRDSSAKPLKPISSIFDLTGPSAGMALEDDRELVEKILESGLAMASESQSSWRASSLKKVEKK